MLNDLSTEARVHRFGSERLKAIYAAMDRESFEQEYECRFLDEADSWIPYAEILPCVREDLVAESDLSGLEACEHPLYAGFDVGRSVHPSELVVLESEPGGPATVRLMRTLCRCEYAEQSATLAACLSLGNVRRLCMDGTGMGAPLAEEVTRRHPLRAEGVTFTSALKERLAVGLKLALQRRLLVLPPDRELIAQIRSIRRTTGEGGRLLFEAGPSGEAGARSHGDKFWALALAWHASETGRAAPLGARRIGTA